MKAVVVGCGRVGASVADELDRAGWQVLIIDLRSAAFARLPASFGGTALRGDGTDEDVLRRAGAENADLFLALTEGDNRNIMAAQLGIEALAARKTVAKVNDPVRAEAYAHLGIATLCRTGLMMDAVDRYLGMPDSGLPGMLAPSGHHDAAHHTGGALRTASLTGATAAAASGGDGTAPHPAEFAPLDGEGPIRYVTTQEA